MEYNFREIEKKWHQKWVENKTYKVVEDENKKKFYVLNMFPYPSGAPDFDNSGVFEKTYTHFQVVSKIFS